MLARLQPQSTVIGLLLLVLSACSASSQTISPAFNGPPTITLVSPVMNDTYRDGAAVNILMRVENAGADVDRVEVTVNGLPTGEITQPNPSGAPTFTVTNLWTAPAPGSYTINALATRADGTASDIANVSIQVVSSSQTINETLNDTQSNPTSAPIASPTATLPPTAEPVEATPVPTEEDVVEDPAVQAEPTDPPTPTQPQLRVEIGANVRSGPGTIFSLAGSYAAGTVTDLLAVAPGGLWYKIRYYNGEAWIAASLVEVLGDTASLPIDPGPPTPVPVTNTPDATIPPPAVADLSIVAWDTPDTINCGEAETTSITIANSGSGASTATTVVLEDLFDGSVQATGSADVRALGPNENVTVNITLTVTTFVVQDHTLRARVDPNGSVAETDESNNDRTLNYTLANGSC